MITMWEVPRRAALVAAGADGPSELVALDNALRGAGIAELNLFAVTSIWPRGCEIVRVPKLEPGTIAPAVMTKIYGSAPGQRIAAALGVAMSENSHGIISEYSNVGITGKEASKTAEAMARHMMENRGLKPAKVTSISADHVVRSHGAAFAAIVFLPPMPQSI